jgi:hypothetical protein
MECIFFTTCHDKIICREIFLIKIFFLDFVKNSFDITNHGVHIRILHLYKIH